MRSRFKRFYIMPPLSKTSNLEFFERQNFQYLGWIDYMSTQNRQLQI